MQLLSTCLASVHDAGNDKPCRQEAINPFVTALHEDFFNCLFRMKPLSSSFQATGSLLMWPTLFFFTPEVYVYIKSVLNQQNHHRNRLLSNSSFTYAITPTRVKC